MIYVRQWTIRLDEQTSAWLVQQAIDADMSANQAASMFIKQARIAGWRIRRGSAPGVASQAGPGLRQTRPGTSPAGEPGKG